MLQNIKRLSVVTYRRMKSAGRILLGYDNAKTDIYNYRHWSQAVKDEPPIVVNSPDVRKKLRIRARYEVDNNSYASGLVSTLAIDTIGYTAPKVRVLLDDSNTKGFIEAEWVRWSENHTVNLSSKLRVMDETKYTEGESFPVVTNDEEVEKETGYRLAFNILPPSRIQNLEFFYTNNLPITSNEYNDDGVVIDLKTGRPKKFRVVSLEEEANGYANTSPSYVDGRFMYQWYNPRRCGQFRGYSELTPAIGLYAQLRRYDLAELTKAEIAASFAGVLKTQGLPIEGPADIAAFKEIPITRGMLLALPDGWDSNQFKTEQSSQNHKDFVDLYLRQIGRCLDVPFGIVAGDSSRYNYSSAQLDYRGYEERKKYDKKQLCIRVMNRLFNEFLLELSTKNEKVRRYYIEKKIFYQWTFSVRPSSDPEKDANAEEKRLAQNTITLSEVYGNRGLDWEEELEQRSIEFKRMEQLGLSDGNPTLVNGNGDKPVNNDSNPSNVNGNNQPDDSKSVSQKDAASTGNIQAAALNGAQIASLLLVTDKVALKQYPAKSAKLILQGSFPLMNQQLINDMIDELATYDPPEPVPVPVGPSEDDDEEDENENKDTPLGEEEDNGE